MYKAFGTIKDTFYIPALLEEPQVMKKDDIIKVRYEVIDTLNAKLNNTTNKQPLKIQYSKKNIPLLGVVMGIEQSWLDQRIQQANDWSISHALHLKFNSSRKIYSTHVELLDKKDWIVKEWNGEKYTSKLKSITRKVPGSYGYSPESTKKMIQELLKVLRTHSNRLAKSPLSVYGAKKYTKDFQFVYGVIEFGAEHNGIHAHLLINIHPDITEEMVNDIWNNIIDDREGGTAKLYDIRDTTTFGVPRVGSKLQRTKAIKYVVSRVIQYEGIGAVDWNNITGYDLTLNDYHTKLCIEDIPAHTKPERYWGKTKGSHRFRQQ